MSAPTHTQWRLYPAEYRWDFSKMKKLEDLTEEDAQAVYELAYGKAYTKEDNVMEEYVPSRNVYVVKGYYTAKYLVQHYACLGSLDGRTHIQDAVGRPEVWAALLDMGYDLFGFKDTPCQPEDFQVDAWGASAKGVELLKECIVGAVKSSGAHDAATRIHWGEGHGGVRLALLPGRHDIPGFAHQDLIHAVWLDSGYLPTGVAWVLKNVEGAGQEGALPLNEEVMTRAFREAVRATALPS